uniref:Uncharacterized protein n=1 Tax=Chromera velia CCMP2878 TaxID=1169474 RepID=A0A0G4FGG7_9ALVE|eukprot:Cvel_16865.t1-p1 / transcript=Cvel_16865.t1 / gene=Cvel_16865 / organism=Chromera_velia_CCMP2878 / gene_product=hypothetical protein / transcript_product=hypothetical protein / location=Cvel_scaffold1319:16495-18468(+) / protein_length=391 / sequence_SO=supercontig / SO=protein_coding / is_pseudo=false
MEREAEREKERNATESSLLRSRALSVALRFSASLSLCLPKTLTTNVKSAQQHTNASQAALSRRGAREAEGGDASLPSSSSIPSSSPPLSRGLPKLFTGADTVVDEWISASCDDLPSDIQAAERASAGDDGGISRGGRGGKEQREDFDSSSGIDAQTTACAPGEGKRGDHRGEQSEGFLPPLPLDLLLHPPSVHSHPHPHPLTAGGHLSEPLPSGFLEISKALTFLRDAKVSFRFLLLRFSRGSGLEKKPPPLPVVSSSGSSRLEEPVDVGNKTQAGSSVLLTEEANTVGRGGGENSGSGSSTSLTSSSSSTSSAPLSSLCSSSRLRLQSDESGSGTRTSRLGQAGLGLGLGLGVGGGSGGGLMGTGGMGGMRLRLAELTDSDVICGILVSC